MQPKEIMAAFARDYREKDSQVNILESYAAFLTSHIFFE